MTAQHAGRPPIVGGNWKMHTTRDEARRLLRDLRSGLEGVRGVEVAVFPPAPWIGDAADYLAGTSIGVGAQNVHWAPFGAFTGEVSAALVAGTVDYVIVGHSERRHVFGETDEQVNAKLRAAVEAGLTPILAVGETLEQHEAGRAIEVLRSQLDAALDGFELCPDRLVVAYEPVWAIGTGLTATPEVAQHACAEVRQRLAERFDGATAEGVRIQYGGSVTPDNIEALAAQPDIDGALVGGASLRADAFTSICRAVAASRRMD